MAPLRCSPAGCRQMLRVICGCCSAVRSRPKRPLPDCESKRLFPKVPARARLRQTQVIQIRTLAPRELQVLRCLADDYSEKETAEELGISPYTVDALVARIRVKFGVHKMTTAVA